MLELIIERVSIADTDVHRLISVVDLELICDWACKNRACGHTKFNHFSKVLLTITFYATILWLWNFYRFMKFIWLCDISYRMEIFYSNIKIWLVKQEIYFVPTYPVFAGQVTYWVAVSAWKNASLAWVEDQKSSPAL